MAPLDRKRDASDVVLAPLLETRLVGVDRNSASFLVITISSGGAPSMFDDGVV
jgi:hypothetical protein